MGWLSGYKFRKSITLSRADGLVTNYQMKLLLGESSGAAGENVDCGAGGISRCQSDFDDIRFTTSDGLTLLDYWIELTSGTTPNQLATIWIEFDSIATTATTFYMYYGKSDATSVSSGINTFQLFDHFDDDSTPAGTWTVPGSKGWSETGTALQRYAANTNDVSVVLSVGTFTAPLAIECNLKVGSDYAAEYGWMMCIMHDTAWGSTGYMQGHFKDASNDYTKLFKFGTGAASNGTTEAVTANQYYRYSLRIGATNQYAFVDNVQKGTIAVAIQTNPSNIGLIAGRTTTPSDYTTYFDYVAVRNYIDTEPAWGTWGAEESNVRGHGFINFQDPGIC